jgi:hypothetical protein
MDRTNLLPGVFDPRGWGRSRVPSRTRRTADETARVLYRLRRASRPPLGNDAGLEVAPERDRQLARHGDDGDAPDAPLAVADALTEPLGERAVGLVAA